jgi:hypothetical protein
MSIITSLDGNLHFYPGHYNDFILKNWNTWERLWDKNLSTFLLSLFIKVWCIFKRFM